MAFGTLAILLLASIAAAIAWFLRDSDLLATFPLESDKELRVFVNDTPAPEHALVTWQIRQSDTALDAGSIGMLAKREPARSRVKLQLTKLGDRRYVLIDEGGAVALAVFDLTGSSPVVTQEAGVLSDSVKAAGDRRDVIQPINADSANVHALWNR
jgi:hypothetical protein